MDFYKIYNPITALPFRSGNEYVELAPCEALRPYVRCFWGSVAPYWSKDVSPASPAAAAGSLVTPDTCMDVILDINHTDRNCETGFCGLDDRSYRVGSSRPGNRFVSTFGIRFYAWSAALFAEDSMRNTRNMGMDAERHFGGLKRVLESRIYESADIFSRIALAEKYLLKRMERMRENRILTEAAGCIVLAKGKIGLKELARRLCVCERQIERVFGEYMGMPPKRFMELVRYQYLWNEVLYGKNDDVQDWVHRFGYTDQPHLLREFKRFHGMTPAQARKYAYQNVGFLQASNRFLE